MPIDPKLKKQLLGFFEDFYSSYKKSWACKITTALNPVHVPILYSTWCKYLQRIVESEHDLTVSRTYPNGVKDFIAGKKLNTVTDLMHALRNFCLTEIPQKVPSHFDLCFKEHWEVQNKKDNILYKELMEILNGKYGFFPEALTRELEQQSRENKLRERDREIETQRLTKENLQLQVQIDALLAGELDTETAEAIDISQLLTSEIRILEELIEKAFLEKEEILQRKLTEKRTQLKDLKKKIKELEFKIMLLEQENIRTQKETRSIDSDIDQVIETEIEVAKAVISAEKARLLKQTKEDCETMILNLEQEIEETKTQIEAEIRKKEQHDRTKTDVLYSSVSYTTTFRPQ